MLGEADTRRINGLMKEAISLSNDEVPKADK
jgi:hypothetical protein